MWLRTSGRPYASLHVPISRPDQLFERGLVDRPARPELHVPHSFARSFEQTGRIRQVDTTEEPDIDVPGEGIDVGKGRVLDAGRWMTIVKQFTHVTAAGPHHLEPSAGGGAELAFMFRHPAMDGRIVTDRSRKSEQPIHHDDRFYIHSTRAQPSIDGFSRQIEKFSTDAKLTQARYGTSRSPATGLTR